MAEKEINLLGLTLSQARQILTENGLPEPTVIYTGSPYRPSEQNNEAYRRSEPGEAEGFSETRVIQVDQNCRTLIVSRFLTAVWNVGKEEKYE